MASKTILNRTRGYAREATKAYVQVPDTSSPAYRQSLQDGFKQRIWQEIQDYNDVGGKVLFGSFTYSPEDRPYFDYVGIDNDGNTCSWHLPCFSKQHYEDFMRRMRTYFYQKYGLTGPGKVKVNRQGKTVIHCEKSIKVIWPSEYGMDDSKQQAPHYHPLIFFPPEYLQTEELKNDAAVKRFMSKMWPHGFIFWSKKDKGGLWVKSSIAATYCSKYCFKSFNYYARQDIRSFLFDKDGKRIKERFEMMKGCLPHAWHSQNFGIGLVEKYDSYEAFCNGIDFQFDDKLKTGHTSRSRMPLYIRRKLLCDLTPGKSYVKNEKCIQWTLRDFLENGKKKALLNASKFTEKALSRLVNDEDIQRLFPSYPFKTVHEFFEHITSILGNRSWTDYYLYNLVWKGLVCEDISHLTWLDELSEVEFYCESYIQYEMSLRSHLYFDSYNPDGYFVSMRKLAHGDFHIKTFDDCFRFQGFDLIKSLYDVVYDDFRYRCDQEYLDNLLLRKQLLFETKTG